MSQRLLSQRLAEDDPDKAETKRRWIGKILRGKINAPGMGDVERALNLPRGYFRLPTPDQIQDRRVRLEELAAEVARDREAQLTFAEEVLARLAALEAGQGIEARRSTPPGTHDEESAS